MNSTTPQLDPQAAQKRASALLNSLVHAGKAPGKPFVHVAIARAGTTAFLADTVADAKAALDAFATLGHRVTFATLGHRVTFALFVGGERTPSFTPLVVEDAT